ncbi:MAG: PAS domain S-box protein [Chloroflexota bacterium]
MARRFDASRISAPGFLTAAAVSVGCVEVVAGATGQAAALLTAVLLFAIAVPFGAAHVLRRRNRPRDAALISAAALFAAVPLFGMLYDDATALVLVPPAAFMIALPHVRGRTLLLTAIVAIAATLAAGLAPDLPAPISSHSTVERAGTWLGVSTIAALVLGLAWRLHRRADAIAHRYQQLLDDLPVGVIRATPDGRIIEANIAYAVMLGYRDPAALLAAEPGSFPYERVDRTSDKEVDRGVGPFEGMVRVHRPDGTEAWHRFIARATFDEAGAPAWYDSAVIDVTAERRDLETRNRLAAVVESAADAVVTVNVEGLIQTWNDGAAEIYGVAAERAVGQSILGFTDDAGQGVASGILASVADGERSGPHEMPMRTPDGRALVVSVLVSPIRDADGRVSGAAIIARDITETRRLAEEQANLEAQLRQAQKMEAIGRLAGGIAHDFNNLLTAILGYGRIVAAGLSGDALADQQHVLLAADRAAALTRRLLDFSRRSAADPRPLLLDRAIDDSLAIVGRLVPERISFEVDLGSDATVVADPVDLMQVLLNLVGNAVDATPADGRITLRTRSVAIDAPSPRYPGIRPGRHAVLEIADTGEGMGEETRARIFEPFFTTKDAGKGTGLGLATVYSIVARAGGSIRVDSGPGAGSTFRILLPVDGGVAIEAERRRQYVPAGHERVLVVEDDPVVREVTSRMLVRAGYVVEVAAGPVEALGMVETWHPDALVTDVVMPLMSGIELADRMVPQVPVVLLSGYPTDRTEHATDGRTDRAFVAKPFEPVTLARALRSVLDGTPREPGGG